MYEQYICYLSVVVVVVVVVVAAAQEWRKLHNEELHNLYS
jgi:hypothetical protein